MSPIEAELVSSSFHHQGKTYILHWSRLHQSEKNQWFQSYATLWSSKALKVGFHLKPDIKYFISQNIDFQNYYDLMISYYLINPTESNHEPTLEEALRKLCNLDLTHYKPHSQKQLWGDEEEELSVLCFFPDLYQIINKKFPSQELDSLQKEIEFPMILVLADMELQGVSLDLNRFQELEKELERGIQKLEKEIFDLAGEVFNINSTQQVAYILFEKLEIHKIVGLKKLKKTKTGYSTDQSVLEDLSSHPLPRLILEHRKLSKLLNTYIAPLPKWIQKKSGKIHTTFHQALTATGRLSSSHPNLQNIPIKSDMGKQIRAAFVPGKKDYLLLSADYSQIELRLLAHFSKDPTLCQAFLEDQDIHTATAAKLFKVPLNKVTREMRSRAKAVNFGIIYGMGPKRLAKSEGLTLTEAKNFIENYFALYPSIQAYINKQLERARKDEKVCTLFGRVRQLEGINSSHERVRAEMERIAINTPIQGSAADIIKKSMVQIYQVLKHKDYRAQMILQIHDELVFEVHHQDLQPVKKMVKGIMESVINLEVPLKVDLGWGKNWLEAHG
ncbi:MAG: DNA polymerase I [Planctomycetota bacterium]|nr:MAG: DNA polymerase I [Planctomycetota bacterium]